MAKTEIKLKELVVGNDITPTTYRMACADGDYPAGTIVEFDSTTKKLKKATAAANMFGIVADDSKATATDNKIVVYVTGRFDFKECVCPVVEGETILDYQVIGKDIGIFFAE